jgi:DNA-binding transcriptional MerR regulator
MPDEQLYSISDVAAAFRVPVSTLRYYDEIGLVPAPVRRSRVRYYDAPALRLLAYVQLWRLDGLLTIEQTSAILASTDHGQRNELLGRSRAELADRIRRLRDAQDVIEHMMRCENDDPLTCPVTGTLLAERVDAALTGQESLTAPTTNGAGPPRGPAAPALARLAKALVRELQQGGGSAELVMPPPGRPEPTSGTGGPAPIVI